MAMPGSRRWSRHFHCESVPWQYIINHMNTLTTSPSIIKVFTVSKVDLLSYSNDSWLVGRQNPPPFWEATRLPSAQPISAGHPQLFHQSVPVAPVRDPPKSIKTRAYALALTWSVVHFGDTGRKPFLKPDIPCDCVVWSSVRDLPWP